MEIGRMSLLKYSINQQLSIGKIHVIGRFCAILFFLISYSFSSFAQIDTCSYTIQGKVLDEETKEPIPYVSVKVKGEEKFSITNIEGEFLIEGLCKEKNSLIISCFGYCDSICEHHHQYGKTPHIYLTQEVFEFGPVTISARKNRMEGTKTISQITLKKEIIRSDPTQSLASALREEQGVSLASTGTNVQIPVIHGLYGNRILILNNGLKHGFQNWGSDHAPEIDISSANNITIVKGASGVRFGPEALGGAIIVDPNPMHLNDPFYTELATGFQSNGRGVFANLETGIGLKNWSYFLNGNYTKIGDKETPDYYLTNSGKEEKSLSFGTRYHLENWDFKFNYSYVNQNLALLRSSVAESGNAFVQAIDSDRPSFIKPFSYDINEPNQLTHHYLGKVEINWWNSTDGKLTFRVGRQLNKRKEYDVRRNVYKPTIDLDLITTDYQLEWKHYDWFQFNGLFGVQFFSQDNDNNPGTGTTPLVPNYNTNRYSAFLIESRRFGKNILEAGVRLDYETNNVRGRETSQEVFRDDYSFTNLTSSIGYVREISEDITFRTNIGTAWRSPNMAELYSFGQHGFKSSFGLLRYYTNDNGELRTNKVIKMSTGSVTPEKGYKFINEFNIRKKKSSFAFTIYGHYIENYIFDRPIAVLGTIRGPMPVFIIDQADAIFLGSDFSWEKNWTNQLLGKFGVSYLYSRNINKNEPLINQPAVAVNYKLAWTQSNFWKFESSKLTIRPSYTFQQFQAPKTIAPKDLIDGSVMINTDTEIFDFKDAPKAYFLLDVTWDFKWKNLSMGISVNNLLNTRYRDYLNEMRYFADEPGRNILFRINYLIKPRTN